MTAMTAKGTLAELRDKVSPKNSLPARSETAAGGVNGKKFTACGYSECKDRIAIGMTHTRVLVNDKGEKTFFHLEKSRDCASAAGIDVSKTGLA